MNLKEVRPFYILSFRFVGIFEIVHRDKGNSI